jgi:hypothetical protein
LGTRVALWGPASAVRKRQEDEPRFQAMREKEAQEKAEREAIRAAAAETKAKITVAYGKTKRKFKPRKG